MKAVGVTGSVQTDIEMELPPVQLQPASTVHVEEQPSPLTKLPSSQSIKKSIPSPHISLHTLVDGSGAYPVEHDPYR